MASDIGPGSIVVCVRGGGHDITPLIEGARYVVREVLKDCLDVHDNSTGDGILLHGIYNKNPTAPCGEDTYCATRFRPIDERDAEIFRAMLAPTKQRTRVHG